MTMDRPRQGRVRTKKKCVTFVVRSLTTGMSWSTIELRTKWILASQRYIMVFSGKSTQIFIHPVQTEDGSQTVDVEFQSVYEKYLATITAQHDVGVLRGIYNFPLNDYDRGIWRIV